MLSFFCTCWCCWCCCCSCWYSSAPPTDVDMLEQIPEWSIVVINGNDMGPKIKKIDWHQFNFLPCTGWDKGQVLCISTSFFSDFTAEINKKRLKMNKKTCFFGFCLLLKAGRHAKSGRLPEGVPWNCLFSADFLLISAVNHWKSFKMNKKSLKTAEKNVSTSFWVYAAPKSWSKYTTNSPSPMDQDP